MSRSTSSVQDEIDEALMKCIQSRECFRNLSISKSKKGVYKIE